MTLAQLVLDRYAAGLKPTAEDLAAIPAAQWDIYWPQLAPLCGASISPSKPKQRNALRIEILSRHNHEWSERCELAESRAARLESALALICDTSERNADVCICEMKRIARAALGEGDSHV